MCMTKTCLQVRKLSLTGVRTLRTLGAKYQNLPYISPYREFHEIGSKVRKVRSPITMRVSEGGKNKSFHRPFLAVFCRARQTPPARPVIPEAAFLPPHHCWSQHHDQ